MVPNKNVLGNPNVTEGDFQLAIESLRESVIGSGKVYDSANTYAQYDFCTYNGISYYSKVSGNIGNTPAINTYWGYTTDILNAVQKVNTTDNCIMRADGTGGAVQASNVFIDDSGNLLVTGGGGLGYGTGSGGTVTQSTSKSTAVTLNKPTGRITMDSSVLAAGASLTFLVYNTTVGPTDIVIVSGYWGAVNPASYRIELALIGAAKRFDIRVTNITGGSLSEAVQINFTVIKGATA